MPRHRTAQTRTEARLPLGASRVAARAGAMMLLSVALTSCGGGSTSTESASPTASTTSTAQGAPLDPANFIDPDTSANQWFPLKPGRQWVREGTTEVGHREVPHQVITTVTGINRTIDGVPTVAVIDKDTDSGQITQVSIDYFAVDKDGNVWNFGTYTEAYEGGRFVKATPDAFLGTTSGEPGILVPSNPTTSTARWFVGQGGKDEGGEAEVVQTGDSTCVPFACYENVLVIREGKATAIDNEFKYYAPGVGLILNTPKQDSLHKDYEQLVKLVQLSKQGLSELNNEVTALEAHAVKTVPETFGSAAVSPSAS